MKIVNTQRVLSLLMLVSVGLIAYTPEQIKRAHELYDSTPEVQALAHPDTEVTAEAAGQAKPGNLSEILCGNKLYTEVARTIQGVLNFEDFVSKKGKGEAPQVEELYNRIYLPALEEAQKQNLDLNKVLTAKLLLNDFGKSPKAKELAAKITGHTFADHDRIAMHIFEAAEVQPEIAREVPTFMALEKHERALLSAIDHAELNIPQFIQLENVPANLQKFLKLSGLAKRVALLESAFDVSGASAHGLQEKIYHFFLKNSLVGYDCLLMGKEAALAYDEYVFSMLEKKIAENNISCTVDRESQIHRALARLCAQKRWANIDQVYKAFTSLEAEIFENLVRELNVTGFDKEQAILIEYAPSFMQTASDANGLNERMEILNKIFTHVRQDIEVKGDVFTLNIKDIALQGINPKVIQKLKAGYYKINKTDDGGYLVLTDTPQEKVEKYFGTLSGYASSASDAMMKKIKA